MYFPARNLQLLLCFACFTLMGMGAQNCKKRDRQEPLAKKSGGESCAAAAISTESEVKARTKSAVAQNPDYKKGFKKGCKINKPDTLTDSDLVIEEVTNSDVMLRFGADQTPLATAGPQMDPYFTFFQRSVSIDNKDFFAQGV